MKVSAVIPTFNRRAYIGRAIDSVLAQTVPVDEIIVVDDGSTDDTAQFVEARYGSRVKVVQQRQGGVSAARHRGVQVAGGEWIAFLDSDDEWTPERTKELLEAAVSLPDDVAWLFGDLRVVTDEGSDTTLFSEYGLSLRGFCEVFADSLTVQYPFQFPMLQASFIRRSALIELDCFTAGLRTDEDLLTGFQVACRYRFAAISRVVGKLYRTSDLASSSLIVNEGSGPDYFRSRMQSFALVIGSGRRRPWNRRYASEVRGLCQLLVRQGQTPRKLALQQFRFGGFSAKGVAFLAAVLLGRPGIGVWNAIGGVRREYLRRPQLDASSKKGHQAYFQSLAEKNSLDAAPTQSSCSPGRNSSANTN